MQIYTLYKSRELVQNVIPIKEGFNWVAFIFSIIWAVYNRLWIWAVLIAGANGCLAWFLVSLQGDFVVKMIAFFGLAVIIGCVSNDIKRKTLIKKGFKEAAILLADGKKTAIARYAIMASDSDISTPHNHAGGPWES